MKMKGHREVEVKQKEENSSTRKVFRTLIQHSDVHICSKQFQTTFKSRSSEKKCIKICNIHTCSIFCHIRIRICIYVFVSLSLNQVDQRDPQLLILCDIMEAFSFGYLLHYNGIFNQINRYSFTLNMAQLLNDEI